jgi:hypothetical protein
MAKSAPPESTSPSRLIDERITELDDWRGEMLSRLRALVKEADPDVVEEWKWRRVPVWYDDGMICTGETYKSRRAIDFHEGEKINEKAFKTLIRAAVTLNKSKA